MHFALSPASAPSTRRCCQAFRAASSVACTRSTAARAALTTAAAAGSAARRHRPPRGPRDGASLGRAASAAALAALLAFSGPPSALADGLDTATYKAGLKATIEASDIGREEAGQVVGKLKNQVLPEAEAQLSQEAEKSGSTYPASAVQELKVVKSEVEALDKQAQGGPSQSVVKSAASGVEQQINVIKAILGFD